MTNKMKLNFELVPEGAWYKNLRSILSSEQWNIVRKYVYKKANDKCMICGKLTQNLDAHETWEYYDDLEIQKLVDVRAVCKDCHRTIHVGLAGIQGELEEALKHYCKVNNCSMDICMKNYRDAFDIWDLLSFIGSWELDISWLNENNFDFKIKTCPNCNKELHINKDIGNAFHECNNCDYKEFIICDNCGKEMKVRKGKYGLFLGCTNYPSCKNTKKIH